MLEIIVRFSRAIYQGGPVISPRSMFTSRVGGGTGLQIHRFFFFSVDFLLLEKAWICWKNPSALRIMGSQNWWFGDPRTLLYRVKPLHRRIQWFLGWSIIFDRFFFWPSFFPYFLCRAGGESTWTISIDESSWEKDPSTPLKTNVTMEKQPFEDVSRIKNGGFPLSCYIVSGGVE